MLHELQRTPWYLSTLIMQYAVFRFFRFWSISLSSWERRLRSQVITYRKGEADIFPKCLSTEARGPLRARAIYQKFTRDDFIQIRGS
jgi:hypothetical protein